MRILVDAFGFIVACAVFVFAVYVSVMLLEWWGLIQNVMVWE